MNKIIFLTIFFGLILNLFAQNIYDLSKEDNLDMFTHLTLKKGDKIKNLKMRIDTSYMAQENDKIYIGSFEFEIDGYNLEIYIEDIVIKPKSKEYAKKFLEDSEIYAVLKNATIVDGYDYYKDVDIEIVDKNNNKIVDLTAYAMFKDDSLLSDDENEISKETHVSMEGGLIYQGYIDIIQN